MLIDEFAWETERQNGAAGFDQYLEIKSLAWPAGAS
jgi:hypothetical protein